MEIKSPIGACAQARCQAPILLESNAELLGKIARMQASLQTMRELLEGQKSAAAATLRYHCDDALGSVKEADHG